MYTYLIQFFSYLAIGGSREKAELHYGWQPESPISFDQPISEHQVDEMIEKVEYHVNSGLYGDDAYRRIVFARVFELKEITFDD